MNVDSSTSLLTSQGVAYAPQIASAARRHGVDPDLLAAVAAQETGGPGSNAGRNVVGDGATAVDSSKSTTAGTHSRKRPAR